MYVCVCHAIVEDEVRDMARRNETLNELLLWEDIATNCQLCLPEIERIFGEENE